MAEVHVTPQALDQVIGKLKRLQQNLEQEVRSNASYVRGLKSQWNDSQYRAFEEQYEDFTRKMKPLVDEDMKTMIVFLKRCKEQAESYNKIRMRK